MGRFDAKVWLQSLTAEAPPARASGYDPDLDALPTDDGPGAHELTPAELPGDWRVHFEERAAIREYDGGQAREHAEAEALRETLAAMRTHR